MIDFFAKLGDQLERLGVREEIARKYYENQEFGEPFDAISDSHPDKLAAFDAADAALEVIDRYRESTPDDKE